jgi:hypothetical protein
MRSGVLYFGLMKKNQYEHDACYVNALLRLTVYQISSDLTFTSHYRKKLIIYSLQLLIDSSH